MTNCITLSLKCHQTSQKSFVSPLRLSLSGRPEEVQRRDADDAGRGGRGGAAATPQVQRQALPAPEAGPRVAPMEGDAGSK